MPDPVLFYPLVLVCTKEGPTVVRSRCGCGVSNDRNEYLITEFEALKSGGNFELEADYWNRRSGCIVYPSSVFEFVAAHDHSSLVWRIRKGFPVSEWSGRIW